MRFDWKEPAPGCYCTTPQGGRAWVSVELKDWEEPSFDPARPWEWVICDWPPCLPEHGDDPPLWCGTAATAQEAMHAAEAAFPSEEEQAQTEREAKAAWQVFRAEQAARRP